MKKAILVMVMALAGLFAVGCGAVDVNHRHDPQKVDVNIHHDPQKVDIHVHRHHKRQRRVEQACPSCSCGPDCECGAGCACGK